MLGLARDIASGALRLDSWKSLFGSFGGRGDRGRADRMAFMATPVLDDHTLSTAYRDMWLVRRVIEARSDDALREGWGIDKEKIPEFLRLNTATHAEGAFQRALRMADLKGGAGLFIGYKSSEGQDLLEPAPVGSEVAFLEVFDKFQLGGQERVRDIDSPEYDRPQVWQVLGTRRAGLRFHQSRMIRFPGAPRGTDLGTTEQDRDWGDSVLQCVWEDVARYGVFWQSVGHLMQLSSVGVLKLQGLIAMLASKNRGDAEARIDVLNETLSLSRLLLLDAGQNEEYHREAVTFTDMPALLQEVQTATAGAFRMPVTKLFGRSPAGMNATGESDTRNWYDEVAVYAHNYVEPRLEQLLAITERTAIDIEFPPLWQPTETEQATVRNLKIQGSERLWSMGTVSDAEIRAAMIEGKLPEETVSGPPKAEPTRAVTTVAVIPPGQNPAAPEDPTAPDDPPPPVRAKPRGDAEALAQVLEDFAAR
jgi:phage-related protein (TIGR01555 family)